jgi:hypothetical protein
LAEREGLPTARRASLEKPRKIGVSARLRYIRMYSPGYFQSTAAPSAR